MPNLGGKNNANRYRRLIIILRVFENSRNVANSIAVALL